MTRNEIYDLLKSIFSEFPVIMVDKSTWSKIVVGPNLEVYTYSGYCDREDSVWYFNIYFNGSGKEIMIPNKDSNKVNDLLSLSMTDIETKIVNNILNGSLKLKFDSKLYNCTALEFNNAVENIKSKLSIIGLEEN